MPVCFTFDIEEHDRIEAAATLPCSDALRREYGRRMEDCTRWLLDAMADAGAQGTFFLVGHIAVTHPRLVHDIAAAGHEIACHSHEHHRLHRLTPDSFRADVRRARAALEQVSGQPVVGYRAPTFSITRDTAWAIDILAEEGFRYDSSVFPVRHDRYGVPDAPRFPFYASGSSRSLLELPPATYALGPFRLPAAGGGYFRLFPPTIMRGAIRQALEQSPAVPVLYFHPWEFDPSQPRLPLGRLSRFRTYVGIKKSRARLQRLLKQFGSRRMIDAVEDVERSAAALPTFALTTDAISDKVCTAVRG
jgi:polysaccharide deacetylase family protein (PEP-CTERM system associated)